MGKRKWIGFVNSMKSRTPGRASTKRRSPRPDREKAALIEEFTGDGTKRVLELGAGGGQGAAAAADLGHSVVAVELVPSLAAQAQRLAATRETGRMTVINEDFCTVSLDGHFDVVCYWDGFGIGTDDDQRRCFDESPHG